MAEKAILDPETLKTQASLTAEQEDALQKEGSALWAEPEKKEETEPEIKETPEPEVKEPKEEAPEPSEEKKAKAEQDRLKAEEDLVSKAREKKETDRTDEDKQAILAVETREKEAYQAEIKAFAEAEKLSLEEAEQELTHIKKVQTHYAGDQKKLSRAVLHSQREYAKLQTQSKQMQEQLQMIHEGKVRVPDGKGGFMLMEKAAFEGDLIKGYRAQFPTKSEGMEDAVVLEEAISYLKTMGAEKNKLAGEKLKIGADQKRKELLSSLPESDREFAAEIKEVLDFVSDSSILDEHYSVEDSVWWAKGKVYDNRVKDAEQKGYERGKKEALENKKIIGEVNPPAAGKSPAKNKPVKSDLTADERERALAMYESTQMTEDEKFTEFLALKKTGSFI